MCSAKTYASGTLVTVTATALDGFEFSSWSGDIGHNVPDNPAIRVTMDRAKTVTAHFVPLYTVLVSVSPGSGGTVVIATSEGSYATSANQTALSIPYALGTTLQLSAKPASGYKFDRWSGNLTGYQGNESGDNLTQGNITLVVTSPEIITAEFSRTINWGAIIGFIAVLVLGSFAGVGLSRVSPRRLKPVASIPGSPQEAGTAQISDVSASAQPEAGQPPPVSDTSGDKSNP